MYNYVKHYEGRQTTSKCKVTGSAESFSDDNVIIVASGNFLVCGSAVVARARKSIPPAANTW